MALFRKHVMNWNKLSQDVATSKSIEIFKFQVTKTFNLMDQEFFNQSF